MGDPVCQGRHLRWFVRVTLTAPNAPNECIRTHMHYTCREREHARMHYTCDSIRIHMHYTYTPYHRMYTFVRTSCTSTYVLIRKDACVQP
jgi:hypothetical protein